MFLGLEKFEETPTPSCRWYSVGHSLSGEVWTRGEFGDGSRAINLSVSKAAPRSVLTYGVNSGTMDNLATGNAVQSQVSAWRERSVLGRRRTLKFNGDPTPRQA